METGREWAMLASVWSAGHPYTYPLVLPEDTGLLGCNPPRYRQHIPHGSTQAPLLHTARTPQRLDVPAQILLR